MRSFVSTLSTIKSPTVHDAALSFLTKLTTTNGAKSLGSEGIKIVCEAIITYVASSNAKVKAAACALTGEFHKQIGLAFKSVLIPLAKTPTLKMLLTETMEKFPHDASSAPAVASDPDDADESISVPRADLSSKLPKSILTKLATTECKNSWKQRKEALEEIQVRRGKKQNKPQNVLRIAF